MRSNVAFLPVMSSIGTLKAEAVDHMNVRLNGAGALAFTTHVTLAHVISVLTNSILMNMSLSFVFAN